ncbi:hypothetical protein AKJ16_DCAP05996 [Drosera capensis]
MLELQTGIQTELGVVYKASWVRGSERLLVMVIPLLLLQRIDLSMLHRYHDFDKALRVQFVSQQMWLVLVERKGEYRTNRVISSIELDSPPGVVDVGFHHFSRGCFRWNSWFSPFLERMFLLDDSVPLWSTATKTYTITVKPMRRFDSQMIHGQ